MKINEKIHRIKCYFNVTDTIRRFVYVYIIFGEYIHIIDTGVSSSYDEIVSYIGEQGRSINEVKSVLLTHTHPDHIGSAYAIKEKSNCIVYSSLMERDWVEDINIQFKERPIPNFYNLVNKSTRIDCFIQDNQILELENDIHIQVIETKGHSHGSLSFIYLEENAMFTGDAIPVVDEIPIFVSCKDSINTLEKILRIPNVVSYLSAWDDTIVSEDMVNNINKAIFLLNNIFNIVKELKKEELKENEIFIRVCERMNLIHLIDNILFKNSIYFTIKEI